MKLDDKSSYKNPWICVGSGPKVVSSFDKAITRVGAKAHIATCNGGYKVCGIPQAYGLFENEAVSLYGDMAQRFIGMGKHIYMNNWGLSSLKLWENPCAKHIDTTYVFKRGAGRQHDYGLMSSGVLMLLIVANEYNPPEIHVCGYDSYEPGNLHAPEIPLWEKIQDREQSWCDVMNDGMAKYIKVVTNLFKNIDFIWHGGKPPHARDDWRVTYAD